MKKTSDCIKDIRALRDIKPPGWAADRTLSGEHIPGIYEAHMSAIETERQRDQARRLVGELFGLLEGSVEGPGVTCEREDEINGLLLLWGIRENPNAPAAWNGDSPNS
jgi:hypothetical protein